MTLTVFTEDAHSGEFIISEANGHRSRENGTLVSGQDLKAGTLLEDDGTGKLTAYTGNTDTAGDLITQVKGILFAAVDASLADQPCAYIARDAEVNANLLTYPAETTDGQGNAVDSLALLGIVAR